MIRPEQCAAARSMLRWTREDLAKRSGVSANTIYNFEKGADSKGTTLDKIRRAFVAAGLEMIENGAASLDGGLGVRWRKRQG